MIPKINSAHGSDTRNIINRAIDLINAQGKSIQDLVAKGQLTPAQYAQLIQTVNGLISKGDVSPLDINKNLGKFDSTYFSSDFLKDLNEGTINTTNVLPNSITSDELASKSVALETISDSVDFLLQKRVIPKSDLELELGSLNGIGNIADANNRIRTNFLTVSGETVLKNRGDGNVKISAYLYDENNIFISSIPFTFSDLPFEHNGKVKFIVAYSDDREIANIKNLADLVDVYTTEKSIKKEHMGIKSVDFENAADSLKDFLKARVITSDELNFKIGGLTASGIVADSSTRVRSEFINSTGKTTLINESNGNIKVSLFLYDLSNKFISSIPFNEKTFTFEHEGQYRLIYAYKDDRQIVETKDLTDSIEIYTTFKSIRNEHLADGIIDGTKIKEKSISKSNIGFISSSTNLFDKNAVHMNKAILSADGTLVDNNSYLTTDYITVKADEYYTSRQFNRVAFYDKDKKYISLLDFTTPEYIDTFKTPDNTVYIRLHINGVYYEPLETRLNKGAELLPFEDYQIYIDGHPIIKDSKGKTEGAVIYPPEEIGKNALLQNKEFQYPTVPELYQMYDELIAEFPKILSKKILGKDTTGEFDIWELHLKPEEYDKSIVGQGAKGTLAGKKPKITFIAGIHGHEQSTVVGTYYFIEALLKQWKNDDVLDYLRHNVEFKFIPLVYPNGYITEMYSNVTGINLQTNFPYNFTPRDIDSPVYSGEEPLTEIEVKYCKKLIDENTDSVLFVDLHSAGFTEDGYPGIDSLFYYLIARDEQYRESMDIITKHSVESITRFLKKNYPIDTDNLLGWVTYRDGNGTADAYAESVGIPSMVIEVPSRTPYNLSKLNSDSIKMSAEVIANSFAISLKYFKDNQ